MHADHKWIGKDVPSLEAESEHEFDVHVPGYDLRRLILARDPLCAANAFWVYIRKVLAVALGVRMCGECPHCSEGDKPCQDGLGSNAEAMGGFAGRGDAMFGAVECQKISGSLHLHLWFFGQRLHQHHSLYDIAKLLQEGIASAQELKDFISNICCESYADLAQYESDIADVEQNWLKLSERCRAETRGGSRGETENAQTTRRDGEEQPHTLIRRQGGSRSSTGTKHTGEAERFNGLGISSDMSAPPGARWGDVRMGRMPGFVREDEGCDTSAMPRSTATERAQSRAALSSLPPSREYSGSTVPPLGRRCRSVGGSAQPVLSPTAVAAAAAASARRETARLVRLVLGVMVRGMVSVMVSVMVRVMIRVMVRVMVRAMVRVMVRVMVRG